MVYIAPRSLEESVRICLRQMAEQRIAIMFIMRTRWKRTLLMKVVSLVDLFTAWKMAVAVVSLVAELSCAM